MQSKTKFIVASLAVGAFTASAGAQDQASSSMKVAQPDATSSVKIPAPSVKDEEKPNKLSFAFGVMGKSLEDEYVNSKHAGGTIDIVGSREFAKELSARMDLSFLMTTGSYTNQYSTGEGSAPNLFAINEAAVTLKPVSALALEAGVIGNKFGSMVTSFDAGTGFPAARETLTAEGDLVKGEFYAMQAIPVSGTGSVKPAEKGVTTTLMRYGAGVTTNPKDRDRLTVSATGYRFQFNNLNASAATDSQYLGNTVESPGPQARFKYGYAGYEVGGEIAYKWTKSVSTSLNGAFLRNEKAPDDRNRAYRYTAGLSVPVFGNKVTGKGGFFYNEGDTIPASYSIGGRGFNNRYGNVAALEIENEKQKVKGYVSYTRANEIVDRPYTADRNTIVFGLEAAYDIL